MNELVGILASKFNGDLAGTEAIFHIANGTTSTLTFTIPSNYVFYLMDFSCISTSSDNTATIRDQSTNVIYTYDEIPDVDSKVINYPFLNKFYKNKITILFSSNLTSSITFRIHGILISLNNQLDFENACYSLVGGR